MATQTSRRAPIDSNTFNEERAAINGGQCANAPTMFHFLGFAWLEPSMSRIAIIVIRRYAWISPTQIIGSCFIKPNGPVPVVRPTVVATALPDATSVKIVPWIRSSRRRNALMPEVDCGVKSVFLETWRNRKARSCVSLANVCAHPIAEAGEARCSDSGAATG